MGLSSSCCPKIEEEVIVGTGQGTIRKSIMCKECKDNIIPIELQQKYDEEENTGCVIM